MASSKAEFRSRDDWRKEKELELARKAGTAAPLQDEEGKDINPHIPQYIAEAPWYLKRNNPSLKHQRPFMGKAETAKVGDWYLRGARGTTATKFRKGACENCGAMTHKTKECCERPRAKGAKFTGENIMPDELVQTIQLDYDGKHDRWNGWQPDMHSEVMQRFDKTEQARKEKKAKALSEKFMTEPDPTQKRFPHSKEGQGGQIEDDSGSEEEQEDYKDSSSVLQSKDPRTRTTIRNLRIREDTAKYLRNLSLDSAYYDPKTRSMRENPTPNLDANDAVYCGDNFIRSTGDAVKFGGIQKFAWEAYEKGQEVHPQAAPSQAELLFEQYKKKKGELKELQREALLKRYGGDEYLNTLPQELVFSQTEHYAEFTRDGRVVKGEAQVVVPRSKYEEDVYHNNHTSVWGSYWEAGQWGYACCKQVVRNSYCTGEAGKRAREEILSEMQQQLMSKNKPTLEPRGEKSKEEQEKERQEKLKQAMEEEEKFHKNYVEKDERKRPYNSLSKETYEVTEEMMEAYQQKKQRFEDPMRNFTTTSS